MNILKPLGGNLTEVKCTCYAEAEYKRHWGSDPTYWPSFGWVHAKGCSGRQEGLVYEN